MIYKNEHSCSVVHSCMRTYNSQEKINDYALNFPQTGFDISVDVKDKNYLVFFWW